jgi:mevalonate kinase
MESFECITYGKWILSGEHTVLRDGGALVFPVKSKFLKLSYVKTNSFLSLNLIGPYGDDYKLVFWGVFENALQKVGKSKDDICGELTIDANLPVGAGLGASAALCVALGRWFISLGYIQESELYNFCRSLEDLFHGESSGVDIAVTIAGQGIYFKKGEPIQPLDLKWRPHWYLSYSGQIGVTSECVKKVKSIIEANPALGETLDQSMKKATEMAKSALLGLSENSGLQQLKEAINSAGKVFKGWQLTEGSLGQHIKELQDQGAIAVKPTGSGGGGYVLSLWQTPPKTNIDLIKL